MAQRDTEYRLTGNPPYLIPPYSWARGTEDQWPWEAMKGYRANPEKALI